MGGSYHGWPMEAMGSAWTLPWLAHGCSRERMRSNVAVDPWLLWGTDEVWAVDIMVDPMSISASNRHFLGSNMKTSSVSREPE